MSQISFSQLNKFLVAIEIIKYSHKQLASTDPNFQKLQICYAILTAIVIRKNVSKNWLKFHEPIPCPQDEVLSAIRKLLDGSVCLILRS